MYWDHISVEGKDFIDRLLKADPSERMTANEALKHSWLIQRRRRRKKEK